MYQKGYRKHIIKSGLIIAFIFAFAIISTYHIYHKFSSLRQKDYDSGQMEVVFHEKKGNEISLTQFIPVTDAIGLSSNAYTFTVKNNTDKKVSYKIVLVKDEKKMLECGCSQKQIPNELLKLSLRKDHEAPKSYILSEVEDEILLKDTLDAKKEEDYSIRIWSLNSDFIVDKTSHYHATIQVIEE